jgi:predicted CopG family antitoxin
MFMHSISIVAAMTTISITEETQTELRKIKGQLMASDGKERSFDDVIMELVKHWKVRRSVHEC